MNHSSPFVLLIDDDEDDLELLSNSLEKSGIRIKKFDSGKKALYYLALLSSEMGLPSLIILDYNMPKNNGEQILLLIKGRNDLKNIPVVMYSTSISAGHKTKLLDLGALDCFIKPWAFLDFNKQVGIFKDLAISFTPNKILA